jgi:hypothetical protein
MLLLQLTLLIALALGHAKMDRAIKNKVKNKP